MAIEILDTWLTSSLASGGTITFSYPSGRTAASYLPSDEVLMIPASGKTVDDPVVTYGSSTITVPYTGATLAANTRIRLQVTVADLPAAGSDAEDYGVIADGVTDTTVSLNSAIAALAAAGGGTLLLEAGKTYKIDSRLDMANGVRIVGYGATILHTDRPFRANALTERAGFEGVTFVGNPGLGGLIQNSDRFTLDRCDFEDQVSSVAITGTSSECRVAFCSFTGSAGSALELNGSGVTGNDILFNEFTDNVGFGVWVTGGAYNNLIEGNKTFDNGLELIGVTYDSHRNRIIGNHAESCGDNGISITGMYNVLTGNVTRGNAFHGLCLYGSRNVVTGHSSMNNGTAGAGYAGIAFTTGFGGIASFNSVTGAFLDDDQSSPTQAHCWKINSGSYTAWAGGQSISGAGIYRTNANKLYRSTGAGTTGATPPTHTTGTVSDDAVSWLYLDTFGNTDEEPGGNVLSGIVLGRSLTSQTLDNTEQQIAAIEGRSHPGYIKGGRFTFWDKGVVNTTMAAIDTIYFYPWYVPRRIIIASMAVKVATGGAGSSVKVGIWANDPENGRPVGAPVVVHNTGAATTGTGEIGLSGTGTLEPGWYWFGTKTTGTPPALVSASALLGAFFPNGANTSALCLSFADTYSNNMPTLAVGASFTAVSAGGAPIISALT